MNFIVVIYCKSLYSLCRLFYCLVKSKYIFSAVNFATLFVFNMLPPTLYSIPEAREEYAGASLIERTGRLHTITELGPADLCTIRKQSVNLKKNNDLGTFLYFTGVDTSNSASIAAHLQGLANLMTAKSQYWFGEKKHWKVPEVTYCAYNAFSRVDMRVTVHIPGKFESSVVNHEGKLISDKILSGDLERLWQETFVSAICRSLLDLEEDDVNKAGGLVEVRKLNPFSDTKSLLEQFMTGFEKLFFDGPKLGCDVEIPQPTRVNNYLVDAFLKCVQLTQNYDQALEVLLRLEKVEPSVVTLVAQVLLMKDEEIQAVQLMNEGIKSNRRDADLLLLQAQFCTSKKRYDLALDLAKQAVKSLPSDFKTWALLVKVYTELGDFENALLCLNSCPMNSHKEKYALKRVILLRGGPEDLHLPLPVDVTLDEVTNLQSTDIVHEQRNLDPQLANLPAANLKSTFAMAYDLLTDIVNKTGWEALLRYRAKVFVMEEEYRKDKKKDASVSKEGLVGSGSKDAVNAEAKGNTNGSLPNGDATNGESSNGESSNGHADSTPVPPVPIEDDILSTAGLKSPSREADANEFKMKRLCERWLDNLFMLLYEDLRAYTMWQAELLHFQAQQMEYKKTTLEWEILGQIAYRLKHFKEGSVAFSNALLGRFSAKSEREMLKFYQMEREKIVAKNSSNVLYTPNYTKIVNQLNQRILESSIKLLVWNHRWYSDFSPWLVNNVLDLVAKEGLIKVQSLVQALYSNGGEGSHGIMEMMEDVFGFLKEYNVAGVDN